MHAVRSTLVCRLLGLTTVEEVLMHRFATNQALVQVYIQTPSDKNLSCFPL